MSCPRNYLGSLRLSVEWRVDYSRNGVISVEEMVDQCRSIRLGTFSSIEELPEWTQQSIAMLDLLSSDPDDRGSDLLSYSHPDIGTRLKTLNVYYLVYRGNDA